MADPNVRHIIEESIPAQERAEQARRLVRDPEVARHVVQDNRDFRMTHYQPLVRSDEKRLAYRPRRDHGDEHRGVIGSPSSSLSRAQPC